MQHKIMTISDQSRFAEILDSYYKNSKIIVKLTSDTVPAEFLGQNNGTAAFKVYSVKNLPKDCLLIAKKGNEVVYGSMKQLEQQEDQLFIFAPLKFQIISSARREERIDVQQQGPGQGKQIIFITSMISNVLIENAMVMEKKKVDKIRDYIVEGLDKAFEHIRVYFASDGMIDPRMKYFSSHKKPIYIPDINKESLAPDIEQYRHYINNIYITDYYVKNNSLISEISVPFLFQMKMPYGYIQANSKAQMQGTSLRSIKQYAMSVDQLFTKNRIFRPSEEHFIVVNVSRKGFGIAFKDRKYIRHFKENTTVTLDMMLSQDVKIPIYAAIRHISIQENKVITVGFEILEMDALGEVTYEEFLEKIK